MTAPATDLDALDLARLDPQGMLATVEATAQQWADGLETALAGPPPGATGPAAVVVAGMGGSGIAGDVAALAATRQGRAPVVPAKGYRLPGWVGPGTLVVAVSHSGNTEETRACVDQAVAAGADLYGVTSGGALAERFAAEGVPTTTIAGGGQPRASLPSLATPVLVALERAGVLDGVTEHLRSVSAHVAALTELWAHEVPTALNEVKQAALALDGRVPSFYGGQGEAALVALRAKCQVNENSKRPAFWHEYPELDHNEVVGWEGLPDVGARFGLVELRTDDEHPQIRRRFEATRAIIGDHLGAHVSHQLTGAHWLERFAGGVLFVDLLSVHLGLLEGADPTPVHAIEDLKRRIAGPDPAGS